MSQNLNEMAAECHEVSRSKNWHEREACQSRGYPARPGVDNAASPEGVDYDRVGTLIALIHSEASEALEELRADKPDHRTFQLYFVDGKDGIPKPEGVAVELADVIIRCLDTAGALGLDIERAYREKVAYNRTRPIRHGGKNL